MASWFNNSHALNNYIQKWEKRAFIAPRYINYEFLRARQFNRLIDILENQKLGGLVMLENDCYPDLVCASLSRLKFIGTIEGGYVETYMGGRIRAIPLSVIATVCNMSMEGVPFKGGLIAHDTWDKFELRDALNFIGYRGDIVGKLAVNNVPTEIRILHYLLT
ncbi:hypothetical protein PIB30_110418, partial [Stylosanthes scabra]|nr:hypothetical protein [Stylosanthes scabra]